MSDDYSGFGFGFVAVLAASVVTELARRTPRLDESLAPYSRNKSRMRQV